MFDYSVDWARNREKENLEKLPDAMDCSGLGDDCPPDAKDECQDEDQDQDAIQVLADIYAQGEARTI